MEQLLKKVLMAVSLLMGAIGVMAQRVTLSQPHGFCNAPFTLSMAVEEVESEVDWTIRYTLDSSTPTASGSRITAIRIACFTAIPPR